MHANITARGVSWDEGSPRRQAHIGDLEEPVHGRHREHSSTHGERVKSTDEGCHRGAEAVAIGLVFALVVIPLVLFMALTEGTMSVLVLRLVDTTISIFLALLWFNTFTCILRHERIKMVFPYAEEVFAVSQVIIMYGVVIAVAYLWRDKDIRLMTLSSCGAHYVAFAGIKATGATQSESSQAVGEFFGKDFSPWGSFLVCFVGLVAFGLVFRVFHVLFTDKVGHEKLDEAVEEMELDIIGLTGSFAVTQAVRHALTGSYPEHSSALAQLYHGPGNQSVVTGAHQNLHYLARLELDEHHHRAWQKWCLLGYAVGLNVVAVLWMVAMSKYGDFADPIKRKVGHVMRALLIMCIAWGYLLWGEWTFMENFFGSHSLIGQMCFAALATLCSLAFIFVIAGLHLARQSAKHFAAVGVMGASLVAAWSWEHVFGAALDIIAEKYQVGYDGLVPRAVLAFIIPVAVLPVYITFIKPRIMEDMEDTEYDPVHNDNESRRTVVHEH